MNYPKITIVTPSYNQGQYLEDTILSVLGQRYPNLEYLIYDAASTDNSVEIIKKYEKELTYWISEKDKGQADAINKGFTRATGDILMWLNSDDILMPNVLHFIAEQYIKKGDGIYFGNCIHFKENTNGVLFARGSDESNFFNNIPLELTDTIIQPASFWSKKVWMHNGILADDFHFGFDWEWFLRAKKNDIPFYFVNKSIAMYRFHEEHKSGSGGRKRQEELLKIYKIYSSKYAQLFELMIDENANMSFLEKNFFRLCRLALGKAFSRTHFLKMMKYKKYKNYTIKEIDTIKGNM
ncbi:glycosyltransferase family 2 protein [Flavobacterium daemonense]|uniref:glycosyltransferase family 2 protein n=1 Tax=Flavobacterium daemonense TaxID=1393049 RepID=UPI0011860868|nr:glycosyltransferase family 2 protein [Flavobacterium daemonense]KAF2333124.1 glycosyltransferase [Flavobacterium daemonense]